MALLDTVERGLPPGGLRAFIRRPQLKSGELPPQFRSSPAKLRRLSTWTLLGANPAS